MKKILAIILLVVITSCSTDDVQDRPIIEANSAPELIAPEDGIVYTLNFENPTMIVDRFVWNPADFGGAVATNYTVEVDNVDNQFANALILGSVAGGTQLSFDVETLNGIALALGATPFTAYSIEGRVKAEIGGGVDAMYSGTVTFVVVPYTTEAPKMYVVGNFLSASGYGNDWTPADAVAISAAGFGETNFEGYVYMNVPSPEYKFLPTNESFDGDYGDDGSFSGVLVQEGESNCMAPSAGYYLVKANTGTGSYSATSYTWGLIGNATGSWDFDQDMTYDPVTEIWSITMNLVVGELKFRANDGWDWNYGDDAADGSLENGGANIAVTQAGNYTVDLDLSNPRAYTYALTLN